MKKILVIEDDEALQLSYQTMLAANGFEVIQAKSGDEGIQLAQTSKPDLIILDIMLPGGPDGFVILDKLKHDEAVSSVPIIIASNVDNRVVDALKMGATWYFIKAQTPLNQVVAKIKELLGVED